MEKNNGREFSVMAVVDGREQEVFIVSSETTDGIPFYNCSINGNEITQLRKDEGKWKQIWGDALPEDVESIGEAIEGSVLGE